MEYQYRVVGIDCADCAAELAEEIRKIEGVLSADIHFLQQKLYFVCDEEKHSVIEQKVFDIIHDDEPDAVITALSEETKHLFKFNIKNIDCADCANEIAEKAMEIEGVEHAEADFMHAILRVQFATSEYIRIENALREMIAREEPDVEFSRYYAEQKVEKKEEHSTQMMIIRLVLGAFLFGLSFILTGITSNISTLVAYIILGYDVIYKAFNNLRRGNLLDEHFLMTIATFAALYLSDWKEATGVMLFYQIGEFFQDLAVDHSRKSIASLMDIRPDYASVQSGTEFIKVDPTEVQIGEIIQVKPGERIPLDGIVVSGSSSLDTASLTGESNLRDVDVDDEVISGVVNTSGVLLIRTTKEFAQSTVSRILSIIEENNETKSKQEKFITKFSHYYTPIVVALAVIVAIVVSLVTGDMNEGIYRACTFLVISCPCALVISIPLSFFTGIGGLSMHGIMLKGANYVEKIAEIRTIVFDKTGTLTTGQFEVSQLLDSLDDTKLMKLAAYAESYSNHPIAKAIQYAYQNEVDQTKISDMQEVAGRGISITLENHHVLVGNYKMMAENGVDCKQYMEPGTYVYVAEDGIFLGCILLNDTVKKNAANAIRDLNKNHACMMVSGDAKEICQEVGKELDIDSIYGGCLPEDKITCVNTVKKDGVVAFVGDGVNDVPVMRSADIGFAMGSLGSDAAIEAADVIITDDNLNKIDTTIRQAKRIIRIANQNIVFAIAIKVLALVLGAFGIANMWMAIFADTGVAILCVINAVRLLHVKE
ncbi:MAG: cadmium-translocating P-type ATPase [Solobacterium sp.]|jgi:cadmium-exporting ATPase|uniref:heavy metal translocating P-type ATPase n=1 Tax=Solobacterium sp. TaxID=2060878 RepID=UPI001CAC2C8E|nr:heavy metal translocating P-type ATPase [Solobacterium sp.]MBF1077682.1 cadmium-translocating P-type ATPase [Solobacterium sp.]MBF1089425.1 cadmium-translocating P-type ATPase [Solobacterium sp.]MBF1095560.1 cadmium-translocating P-type ATPase [Solobacterium sp.]MBF1118707.1 cadmium-translocating P-type ATPase [Solobacterium sp.]